MKHAVGFATRLLVILMLIATPLAGAKGFARTDAPRIPLKEGTSTNWSGYAVYSSSTKKTQNESWTYVEGTWTVPKVSGTGVNAYSSIWVGLDGYTSNTVEQLGTEQDTSATGTATYSAWYELYPKMPVTIPYDVNPGDSITASVTYNGKSFLLSMTDYGSAGTEQWSFTVTQKCPNAKRSSAEWIVEAPWSGSVLPLANFDKATFTGARAASSSSGGLKPISTFANHDRIDMVSSTGVTKATTSELGNTGDSFTVTWNAN